MTEFLVMKNAPLVEVIAEVHWKLVESPASAGDHDPIWFSFANRMTEWARSEGYGHSDVLVPAGVQIPLAMIGRAPILRFRKEPGTWPLLQLGQGLLTVNAVPPYDGWEQAIAPKLRSALTAISNVRAARKPFAAVDKLELRYIDAFSRKHAVADPAGYLRELRLTPSIPSAWAALNTNRDEEEFSGQYQFKLTKPASSAAVVSYRVGVLNTVVGNNSDRAAIFEFVVSTQPGSALTIEEVMQWFEEAHDVSRVLVNGAISDEVRKAVM